MINDKYRVNEVAKDLNVQMKDIVDLLEKNFPGEKKRTTVLTNEELNFVFETYTQQHQQDNLDSYYAYKVQSQPVKQEKAAAKKTAAKQPSGSFRWICRGKYLFLTIFRSGSFCVTNPAGRCAAWGAEGRKFITPIHMINTLACW